jgi:DNA polymerase III alpha subunit
MFGWQEGSHDKKDEYLEAIKYEFSEIEKCNMADYFIDDYYIVQKGLANGGIITDTGRGSAPSFYINKLLGLTKVDRINSVVKLYPERFMTATRILDSKTPPDIDNNVADREPFIKAQRELMGNLSSFDLIAVGKLKLKSAFKMLARAKDINPQLANKITKQIDSYELAKKHSESEVDITKFVDSEYLSLLKVKRTFWEEVKFQIRDIFSDFVDFFEMIKENTYDVWLEKFGEGINVALLMGGVLLVMIIAVTVINGHHK